MTRLNQMPLRSPPRLRTSTSMRRLPPFSPELQTPSWIVGGVGAKYGIGRVGVWIVFHLCRLYFQPFAANGPDGLDLKGNPLTPHEPCVQFRNFALGNLQPTSTKVSPLYWHLLRPTILTDGIQPNALGHFIGHVERELSRMLRPLMKVARQPTNVLEYGLNGSATSPTPPLPTLLPHFACRLRRDHRHQDGCPCLAWLC